MRPEPKKEETKNLPRNFMLSELTPAPELPKVDLEAELKRRLQQKRQARDTGNRNIESSSQKKTPLEKLEERVRDRKEEREEKRRDDRVKHRDVDWVIFLSKLYG